jgi:hypothetical protein
MPIRINLLAEAQAIEESRRKDPVKRAILGGILIVVGVMIWSSTVQVKIASARANLTGLQASWKKIEQSYQAAIDTKHESLETEEKLVGLQQLTTNRFLWGTTLNALQQTLNGIDDVQVLRVKAEQTYFQTEEIKAKTGETRPPKAATAIEKIVMTIDGVDFTTPSGGQINKFKARIASDPFFQSTLNKTNGVTLLSFSQPQTDALHPNPFVKFSLQCLVPEKVR